MESEDYDLAAWYGYTEEEEAALWAGAKKAERESLRIGVKNAFKQRCKREENFSLNRMQRWFYTVKCLLCVVFSLEWEPNKKHRVTGDWRDSYPDTIEVSEISYRTLYAGWEAEWLEVGHGIFKNWFWRIQSDGDWNM